MSMEAVTSVVYPSDEVCPYPYAHFAALRKEAPVHKVPGRDEYLVSRHADIVEVMRQPDLFSNLVFIIEDGVSRVARLDDVRPNRAGPIFSSDPPAHTKKRRIAFEYVKPGRLQAYEPVIAGIVDELIDCFQARGEVEFVQEFAVPLPTRAIMAVLGFPPEDAEKTLAWGDYDGHGNRYLPPERRKNVELGIRAMVDHVREAVLARHSEPRDDMLSDFVRARVDADGGALDLPNVVAETVNFINGGMHTTRDMLGNTMRFLLERPDQRALALSDPALLVKAIEESLRLETTLQWTGRLVLRDTHVAGTPVPAGSVLILLLASANRDAAVFGAADSFDLRRPELKSHLAFGTHIHSCLGAPFARAEGRIAFDRLFARLRNLRFAPGNDFAPRDSFNFRGLHALHLDFDPGESA
jgi:cytochrome P450